MARCQLLGHLQAGSLEAAGAGWAQRMTVSSSSSGAPFVCPAVSRPSSAGTSCRPRLTHTWAHSWLLIFSLLVGSVLKGPSQRKRGAGPFSHTLVCSLASVRNPHRG